MLLVSTLEHIGADNERYGLEGEPDDGGARSRRCGELRRVLRSDGSLLVTVPLGEPGDYGWFRQEDERGWNRLYARAGFFVAEQEAYELTEDGWRAAPDFDAEGVLYGTKGPAASAVLCAELRPGQAPPPDHARRPLDDGTPPRAAAPAPAATAGAQQDG